MKKLTPQSIQLAFPGRENSWRVRRFNSRAVALRYALLSLTLFAGIGVVQGQQPDPLTITKEGNVGVGTITPANKLSVAGNADFSGNLSVSGNANILGSAGIGTNDPGTSKFRIANSAGDFAHFRWAAAGGGELEFVSWTNGWNINSRTAGKNLYLNRDSSSDVWIGPFGKELIVKGDTGNVGLGTAPVNRLSVAGNADFSGNVGIGTTNPTKAKLEINGSVNATLGRLAYLTPDNISVLGNPPVGISGGTSTSITLYANGVVAADRFYAFSDERLKRIAGRSVAARDLDTLLSIEVTDYSYVDSIAKGTGIQKKVTGQQVEKVFPQAVSKGTDVVPDIYQQATIKDGWVMLATNLKKGERVRLIGEKQEGIHEVLEVAEGRFRTAFVAGGGQIFVYGREVNDARRVDYEAISMLNVSATQELARRLEQLEEREVQPAKPEQKDAEVKALQEENAALRSQLAAQGKRLAAIETLLLSGDKTAARSASLKKMN